MYIIIGCTIFMKVCQCLMTYRHTLWIVAKLHKLRNMSTTIIKQQSIYYIGQWMLLFIFSNTSRHSQSQVVVLAGCSLDTVGCTCITTHPLHCCCLRWWSRCCRICWRQCLPTVVSKFYLHGGPLWQCGLDGLIVISTPKAQTKAHAPHCPILSHLLKFTSFLHGNVFSRVFSRQPQNWNEMC